MLNLLPSVLVIGLCIGIFAVIRRGIFTQRRVDLAIAASNGSADAVVAAYIFRTMRKRNIVAITAAGFAFVISFLLQTLFSQTYGLFAIVSPSLAALLAVGIYAAWPIPAEYLAPSSTIDAKTSANLTPRSTGMFGPAWGIIVPGALLVVLIGGLLVAGIFSGSDEAGLYRTFPFKSADGARLNENMIVTQIEVTTGWTTPFPGWYYGLPILGILILSGILMLRALNSNAHRPVFRSEGLLEFDRAVRINEGYILSTGMSMLLCFQAVPLLGMASNAISNAGMNIVYQIGMVIEDDMHPPVVMDPGMAALSAALRILALLLAIVGIMLLVKLVGWVGSTFGSLEQKSNESAPA